MKEKNYLRNTEETKIQTEVHQKKSKSTKKSRLPLMIVMILAVFMLIKGVMLQPQINKNIEKISELEAQIDYEQQKADEVDNLKQKVNTDEYIEKMAREKLGMIRKDEIVFIDVTSEEE